MTVTIINVSMAVIVQHLDLIVEGVSFLLIVVLYICHRK